LEPKLFAFMRMGRRTFAEQHYLLKRALTEMSNCSCCSMDGTMIESGGMQELMQQEAAFFGMDQSCMNMLTERVAAKQQEAQALAGERQAAAAATESPPLQPPYVRKSASTSSTWTRGRRSGIIAVGMPSK